MKYPISTTPIALYNQSNPQLWRLAEEFVKVAEPKKVRTAFKVATAILAVSIVGMPIAFAIVNWRLSNMASKEVKVFNALKSLQDMQIRNHIQEEINIHWNGNAAPTLGLNGDTALVMREIKNRIGFDRSDELTWQVLRNRPNFAPFNLEELRARQGGTSEAALLLPDPAKPQPPSYESMFDQKSPPEYYELK